MGFSRVFSLIFLFALLSVPVLEPEELVASDAINTQILRSAEHFRGRVAKRSYRRIIRRDRVRVVERRQPGNRRLLLSRDALGSNSTIERPVFRGRDRLFVRINLPPKLRSRVQRITLDGQRRRPRAKRIMLPKECGVSRLKIYLRGVRVPIEHSISKNLLDASGKSICKERKPGLIPDPGSLSGLWFNSGEDKVTRDELRLHQGEVSPNSLWNGEKVVLRASRNEVLAFNTILEAVAEPVQISEFNLSQLKGPGGYLLKNKKVSGDDLFNWVGRHIEHFYIRYLEIKGLSRLFYEHYDERHIPSRLQRPYNGEGLGVGSWGDRPGANKEFPEIAVPLSLEMPFTVAANSNQSIWTDLFIPKNAPAGMYYGTLRINEVGGDLREIPVELEVLPIVLPDEPNSKTMLYLGYMDMNLRYVGEAYPQGPAQKALSEQIRDRHFMAARRHKITLFDSNRGTDSWPHDAPRPAWIPRLNGTIFTAENGYDGPGIGLGSDLFSIGTYGTWNWQGGGQAAMWQRTDNWATWFQNNSPDTEIFLYLIDESTDYAQTNMWAGWMNSNPGIGSTIPSFATASLPSALNHMPNLDIAAGWMATGITEQWQAAADYLNSTPGKQAFMYNGKRPATGSFAIEDDGVSLRQLPWAQYKKGISRWFFWESTYYNNFQGGTGQTDVFNSAFTFGGNSSFNSVIGQTGWNYSNGDGVLFYPGTDTVFPDSSYGIKGPIVSLRMKHWRRGIQDIDYVALAAAINPTAVAQIVQGMVPEVLWEPGVSDMNDPSWKRTDISWSIDPDDWEAARSALIDIILGE